MKVLLVIEGTYPWYRGGVSEWIYQYIRNCTEIDFEILQIATDEFFDLNPEEALYPLPSNIKNFIRVSPPEITPDWSISSEKWYSTLSQDIDAVSDDIDVVHVANTGFAGWIGIKISQKLNTPLVLTEHAIYWLEIEKGAVALECGYKIPEHSNEKEIIVEIFKDIAKEVYSYADRIVTVSECNIELQNQLGATDVTYIPNGISSNWIEPLKNRSSRPTFGWVGRCAEMKNPLQFFDFVEEFSKVGFEADFIMLLSDANEKALEQEVIERAKAFPFVKMIWNQASKEYYSLMDMLFVTSHNESQPLVMFEALSKKVLPTGRQVGDLTSTYGFVFSGETSSTVIVQSIIELWEDDNRFNALVEERFEKVREEHTWENIFFSYSRLLANSLETKMSFS